MKNILIKLFIKDYRNINRQETRKAYGTLVSFFGIISNTLVCLLKIIFGIIFNMVSVLGDGINNLSDAFSNIVSLIGFKFSSKPADKSHPFGHARIEYIAGFIIALFIDFVGFELIIQSVQKIINNQTNAYDTKFLIIASIVLPISILVKLYQCYFNYSIGKLINSTTLKLTALDSRNDVIATSTVLLGIYISYFSGFNLDGYLGVAVGIFIIFSSIKSVIEVIDQLIGKTPDKKTINQFISYIKAFDGVLGIHDLQIHTYGTNNLFATCHVEIDAEQDVLKSHELLDDIENQMYEKYNIKTVLHMDPVILHNEEYDKIKQEFVTLINSIDRNLSFHDLRLVKGPTFINVIFDIVIPENLVKKEKSLIKEIEDKAKSINPCYKCIIKVDYDFEDLAKE